MLHKKGKFYVIHVVNSFPKFAGFMYDDEHCTMSLIIVLVIWFPTSFLLVFMLLISLHALSFSFNNFKWFIFRLKPNRIMYSCLIVHYPLHTVTLFSVVLWLLLGLNLLVILLNAFGMFPQYCTHSISLIIVILSSVHLKALGRMHYSSTFNFLKLNS